MRIESQVPVIGAAFVGGMAQSWLVQKYPEWSWTMSIAAIAGGVFLGMRTGWMESIGLGLAASGAAALGVTLVPITAGSPAGQSVVRRQIAGRGQQMMIPAGRGSYSVPANVGYAPKPEFEDVRIV